MSDSHTMNTYTKLFSSIVTSTIWQESKETKVVWVTMLALADKNGEVAGSIPGLAYISGVTTEECEAALETLLSPDPYSRTVENEGRRIEKIDGGWLLLNHAKYRRMASIDEVREAAAERKRRSRERGTGTGETGRDRHKMSQNVTVKPYSTEADAKADAEEERDISPSPKAHPAEPGPLTKEFLAAWNALPPVFPRIQALTGKRRTALKARMGDSRWRSQWRTALEQMKTMPFCTGDNDRGWVGNPDWFLRPDTVTKIVEGQYGGNGKPTSKAPPKYFSHTGPKERALKEREEQLRAELPDDAATAAMLAKLAEKFPTQRT